MSKRKAIAMLLVVTLAVSLVLTGCGSSGKPKVEGPQEITANLGDEPAQMNTLLTTDVLSFNIIRHVYEGLVGLDKDNKPIPGIATKWDISDDGLVYTFTLRKDAKWSNGTPVTAKDFAFAFTSLVDPATAADYASMGFYIKNAAKFYEGQAKKEDLGIKVVDDYKLEITLETPTAYFIDLMAFGVFMPVNEEFYKTQVQGDKVLYGTEAETMIYNGPYIISEWAHEDKMVLTKNPNYYAPDANYLDKITWLMVKDSTSAYNMYAGDELDMVGLPGSEMVEKAKADGYEVSQYSDGSSWYLEFNHKDPVTSNFNIRKALTYAIDRESFVKNVLKNSSKPALSFTNPDIKGEKKTFYEEVGDLFKDKQFDEAKKALADGMKELNLTEAPKIEFLSDDGDTAKKYAAAVQEFWKKNLDLNADVVTVPFKTRIQRMQEEQFQVVFAGWGPDFNDPVTFVDLWESTNPNNHGKYTNADYDALIKNAKSETDMAKRFGYLKDAEKKVVEDMIVGPIYFRMRDFSVKPNLKGVLRNAFQDISFLGAYVDNSAE